MLSVKERENWNEIKLKKSADTSACPPTLTHLQLQHAITVMMQPEIALNKPGGMLSVMRS